MKTVEKKPVGKNAQKTEQPKKPPVQKKTEVIVIPNQSEVKAIQPIKKELENVLQHLKPTAEDRIQNAENFQLLTEKYKHVKSKAKELNAFKISSDGNKEMIVLKNSAGIEVEVTNSKVIESALILFTDVLNDLLIKTDNEVKDFVI